MPQEPLTLYKLIVLYMLSRAAFPITKARIGDFILEKEYTNFLTLQQAIAELIDTGLITAKSIRNRTHLRITEDGKETLTYFSGRLNNSIKEEIDAFFISNEIEMRNEVSIQADYYKSPNGEYETHLLAMEKGIPIADIRLSVPDADIAAAVCDNWQKKNQEIYKYLISQLF